MPVDVWITIAVAVCAVAGAVLVFFERKRRRERALQSSVDRHVSKGEIWDKWMEEQAEAEAEEAKKHPRTRA